MLLSTAATSEFQMIPVHPHRHRTSGILHRTVRPVAGVDCGGEIMPLYYVADALDKVMIRGQGISAIWADVGLLLALTLIFMTANTMLLKRYRRI
jgi:ABC-2 type transport system permease protein